MKQITEQTLLTLSKEDIIEKFLLLQKEAFPAFGPSYKFMVTKASKKIQRMSEVNKNLMTDPKSRSCYTCCYLHDQTCNQIKKQNLAALVKWSGCGLHSFDEIQTKG